MLETPFFNKTIPKDRYIKIILLAPSGFNR